MKIIIRRAAIAFEANVFNTNSIEAIILETFEVSDNPFEKWRCLFNKDPFEEQDWLRIGTSNISHLLLLFCAGLILSTFIFLGEILRFKIRNEA